MPSTCNRLPRRLSGKEAACQCRRLRRCSFDPWAGKISWRRKWQPTPAFLPGESHRQRSLASYSPWGCKVSEQLSTHSCMHTLITQQLGAVLESWDPSPGSLMLTTWMAAMEHACWCFLPACPSGALTTQYLCGRSLFSHTLVLQAGSHMLQEKLKHPSFREKVGSQELMFPICVAMEVT